MHRFFLTELTGEVDATVDLSPVHHQLARVLRVAPGEHVMVLDNAGRARMVEVVAVRAAHRHGTRAGGGGGAGGTDRTGDVVAVWA